MDTDALVQVVQTGLAERAVPANVAPMQAYLKTDMPFYGVKKPEQRQVRRLAKSIRPGTGSEYVAGVRALWDLPHREEKYLAIDWARDQRRFVSRAALPLYLQMIREGGWWDLVDVIASHLVGEVWRADRDHVGPLADAWIEDDDLWVRRTAIIGQLRHKHQTDVDRLFAYCEACAHERDFFIRKAIGWALRQHGRTDPDAVRAFVERMGEGLSGLSRREALKHL